MMDINLLTRLLQVTDSAYPTGGFSHSLGLEAFVQRNEIGRARNDHSALYQAFVCILENSGSFCIPFVKAAHKGVASCRATTDMNTQSDSGIKGGCDLVALDKMCEACSTNHIARRASTRQGKSFLEVACLTFTHLAEELNSVLVNLPHCHFPVVYGAVLAKLGLDETTVLASFLYGVVRCAIATSVRLDVLGAMEGQKVQNTLQQLIPEIIERNSSRTADRACIKFPVIDILQNTHDTLFCKLFYS